MNGGFAERLDLRQLRLVGGGVVLVVAGALFTYLLWPQAKAYRAASAARSTLEAVAESGAELEQQLEQRSASIIALKRQLHGDMADVPVKEMEAFVVGRLQNISWRHEVELVGVRPAEGESVQSFHEIVFRVELSGGYTDLFNWLWEVRRELGFVVVKEYEMERLDQRDRDPRLRARLTMASYRAVAQ